MIFCPHCGKEIIKEELIKLFKCKYRLENNDIDSIPGEPFVTVRHTKQCFPFGVRYNSKTKKFRVEK